MTLLQILDSTNAMAKTASNGENPHSILPLVLFFGIIPLAFLVYCLRDILPRTYSGNLKKVWIVLIIILPMLGPLLYLFVGQDKAIR